MMTPPDDIRQAVRVLRQGGVIVYPTDTIWGIGCDATNAAVVERVYQIKRRADSKALLCLLDSTIRLQRYARSLPDVAWDLLSLATTPTTLVLDNITGLAHNVYAADGTVGIRITRETFSKTLCFAFEKPIVSTSANISLQPAPRTFSDISSDILAAADYVCASRHDEHEPQRPSSIIRLTSDGVVEILRR